MANSERRRELGYKGDRRFYRIQRLKRSDRWAIVGGGVVISTSWSPGSLKRLLTLLNTAYELGHWHGEGHVSL